MGPVSSLKCRLVATNVGGSPAFAVKSKWHVDGQTPESTEVVAPSQNITKTILVNLGYGPELEVLMSLEYQSPLGVKVKEEHKVYPFIQTGQGGMIISGVTLNHRTYHHCAQPGIEIEDA